MLAFGEGDIGQPASALPGSGELKLTKHHQAIVVLIAGQFEICRHAHDICETNAIPVLEK